jgi:hypothetical protein
MAVPKLVLVSVRNPTYPANFPSIANHGLPYAPAGVVGTIFLAPECRFLNSLEPHTVSSVKSGLDGLGFYLVFIPALKSASYNSRMYPVVHATWPQQLGERLNCEGGAE